MCGCMVFLTGGSGMNNLMLNPADFCYWTLRKKFG